MSLDSNSNPFDDFRAMPSHLPSFQEGLASQTTLDDTLHLISRLESTRLTNDQVAELEVARQKEAHIRAFLAPIRLLPDELLSEIFQAYHTFWSCSPWTLTSVCQRWRTIAFDTMVLWNSISYKPPDFSFRYEYNREICRNTADLRRAFARSKQAPVDLFLWKERAQDDSDDNELPGLLDSVALRIRKLHVTFHQDFQPLDSSEIFDKLITQPLLSLEELDVTSLNDATSCQQFLQLVDSTSSKLRKVRFDGFGPDLLSNFTFWSRLTTIIADQPVVFNILSQCHNVCHLNILTIDHPTGDAIPSSVTTLPHLEKLIIPDPHCFLTQISTPNLRFLHLFGDFVSPAIAAPLNLPSLEEVEIYGDCTIYTDFCIAPKLNRLGITKGQVEVLPARNDKHTTTLTSLESLALNEVNIDYDSLFDLLERNTGIKELYLGRRCIQGTDCIPRIADALISKDKQVFLCPQLERASIGCSPFFQSQTLRKTLRSLLSSRKECGHPLSLLHHIRWLSHQQFQQFIDLVETENDDDLDEDANAKGSNMYFDE